MGPTRSTRTPQRMPVSSGVLRVCSKAPKSQTDIFSKFLRRLSRNKCKKYLEM